MLWSAPTTMTIARQLLRLTLLLAPVAAPGFVLGCGGEGECIVLALPTAQVSVARGAMGNVAATFTNSKGFVDSVSVVGAPPGVTSIFQPPAGTGPSTIVSSGTLVVMVAASTTPGTYMVTVEARQYTDGVACVSTVTLTLTVT